MWVYTRLSKSYSKALSSNPLELAIRLMKKPEWDKKEKTE
jgi:hypothetical protein